MSGSTRSSEGLDPRRRKVLFRSWHRGMRETDLLMGRFADAEIGTMTDAELDAFEELMEAPDRDLLAWLTGEREVERQHDTPVFRRLKAFHVHSAPLNV